MKKKIYLSIWTYALIAMVGCGTKSAEKSDSEDGALAEMTDSVDVADEQDDAVDEDAETCRAAEAAKVVRLLRPVATMYYDEEAGQTGDVTDSLAPGYYNYQGETKEYYLVCLGQDSPYTIPKKDSEVVTLTAAQGHGYVLLVNEKLSTVYLKAEPSDDSKTVKAFPDPEGIPEDAECLGVFGEWYKVKYEDEIAYVKRSEVQWNISSADACGAVR